MKTMNLFVLASFVCLAIGCCAVGEDTSVEIDLSSPWDRLEVEDMSGKSIPHLNVLAEYLCTELMSVQGRPIYTADEVKKAMKKRLSASAGEEGAADPRPLVAVPKQLIQVKMLDADRKKIDMAMTGTQILILRLEASLSVSEGGRLIGRRILASNIKALQGDGESSENGLLLTGFRDLAQKATQKETASKPKSKREPSGRPVEDPF